MFSCDFDIIEGIVISQLDCFTVSEDVVKCYQNLIRPILFVISGLRLLQYARKSYASFTEIFLISNRTVL